MYLTSIWANMPDFTSVMLIIITVVITTFGSVFFNLIKGYLRKSFIKEAKIDSIIYANKNINGLTTLSEFGKVWSFHYDSELKRRIGEEAFIKGEH